MLKAKKKTTTEIICQNLNLPKQTIFQDYKCILESGLSYFGRLYIGQQHLMFVSNMFGFVKKIAIEFDTITNLTEITNEKITLTGKCFKDPNDSTQEFTFSGFKNSNAFKMIKALWKREKLELDASSSNSDESEYGQKFSQNNELDQSTMEISIFNPSIVETEKQKMFEVVLPCSIEQFYRFFLADDATVYPRTKHFQLKKSTKIVATPWKKNQQVNAQTRQLSAIMKVKGVPFKSEAGLHQIWLLQRPSPDQLNVKAISQMSDIPFSAYFTCEEHMNVTKEGQNKCKLIISNAVVFNKPTYMKNAILSRTFSDLKQDYEMWTENVKAQLQKLKRNSQESERKKVRQSSSIDVEFQAHISSEKHIEPSNSFQKLQAQDQIKKSNKIDQLQNRINQLLKLIVVLIGFVGLNTLINLYFFNANNKTTICQTLHS